MSNATQLQYPNPHHATFGRIGRRAERAHEVPSRFATSSANDADFGAGESEATTRHTLAANGFAAAALTRSDGYEHLSSAALQSAARSHRAAGFGAAQRALFAAVVGGIRQLLERFRQWQRVRANCQALSALDDHTLRDIGLARCEIGSLAQEFDQPAATRVHALLSRRGH